MTAISDELSRARTSEAGFHMHLVKPVDPAKLVEVVDNLFRGAEPSLNMSKQKCPCTHSL